MSGTTPELALGTAVDTDDTADYLTLTLANSLRTVDALFNNVTGHTHASAHQGGPIAATSLRGALDFPDWFRSTGHTTAYATTGVGIELFWNGTQGVLQSRNAATAAAQPVVVYGSTVTLGAGLGGTSLTIAADSTITTATSLTVGGNLSVAGGTTLQGVSVVGSLGVGGTINAQAINCTTLSASGNLGVNGVATINGAASVGGVLNVNGGTLYLVANNDTYIQRAGADALRVPTTVYVGNTDTYFQRNAAGAIMVNNRLRFTVDSGGGPGVIDWPGGALVGNGTSVGRSGAVVYLSAHAFVFFDFEAGHTVTCQNLVQTSDPNLKSNMVVVPDGDCMTRVRNTGMEVKAYQLTPPEGEPIGPNPTPTDVGFDATQVYAVAPEFAALNDQGQPVGVTYSNMAAMLWGALRSLDARCVAKGI